MTVFIFFFEGFIQNFIDFVLRLLSGIVLIAYLLFPWKVGTDYDLDEYDIVINEDITTVFGDKLHLIIETTRTFHHDIIQYKISVQDATNESEFSLPLSEFFYLRDKPKEVYDNLLDQVKPIVCSDGVSVYRIGNYRSDPYLCVSGDFVGTIGNWGSYPSRSDTYLSAELSIRGCNALLKLGRLSHIKKIQNFAVPKDIESLIYMRNYITGWQLVVEQETPETWLEYNYTRADIIALINENRTMIEDYALRWANGHWTEEELETNVAMGYEADDLMNWAKEFLNQNSLQTR